MQTVTRIERFLVLFIGAMRTSKPSHIARLLNGSNLQNHGSFAKKGKIRDDNRENVLLEFNHLYRYNCRGTKKGDSRRLE